MELLDIKAVCCLFGGSKPLNPCSIYRYIQKGYLPKPVKVGGNSRWRKEEVIAALDKMTGVGHGG
jgi:predicted DNA-binding transcriptional regulator AlpA